MTDVSQFEPFPKLARFNRQITVTEKIDGTNAQVAITEDGDIYFGSRKRWITPEDDNAGFARWGSQYREELVALLGPGRHFGEWWGQGIQRNYGLDHKRFSLFNTGRWSDDDFVGCGIATIGVVPVLDIWSPQQDATWAATATWPHRVLRALDDLQFNGSVAAQGFARPEGVVVYHSASRQSYKITLDADGKPKGSKE